MTETSDQVKRLNLYVVFFIAVIWLTGFALMRVSSSPIMRGAAFLWFPAAFQLVAGVWLGPLRGMIAGGLGAYAAGITAYGGFGPPDIIMNLVAGGITNALLPALLFKALRIDPTFGSPSGSLMRGTSRLAVLGVLCLVVATGLQLLPSLQVDPDSASLVSIATTSIIKFLPSLLLLLSAPFWLGEIKIQLKSDFRKGFAVVIFCSFMSASLGVVGGMVSGKSLGASVLGIGVGWFFGNSVASILGLYLLAQYTAQARANGLVA